MIAAEEEREKESGGHGRSRRLVTEFSFRIPGHRAEFSGAFSGRFFGQFVSLTPIPPAKGTTPTTAPGCFLFQAVPMQFQRRHTRPTRTNDLVPGQTRYPIKIAAKADAESLLLSPWREIDFSLLRGRLNGTVCGERRR